MEKLYRLARLKPTIYLGFLAAFLYSSWPLGYIFNPFVWRHDLASQLAAPHQPYNWLFIVADILTGFILVVIGLLQLKRRSSLISPLSVYGYVFFGILVALAAMTPLNCDPAVDNCGPILRDPRLIIHGICSIVSVVFLLIAAIATSRTVYEVSAPKIIRWVFKGILFSWLVFGAGSLLEMKLHIHNNLLQYYFITICSLSVLCVVSAVEYIGQKATKIA